MNLPASVSYQRRRTEQRRAAGDALRMTPGERRVDVARRVRDLLGSTLRRTAGPGDPIPSEAALSTALGTSRNAVRGALEQLRQEGRIDRLQGAGSFAVSRIATGRCDLLQDSIHPSSGGARTRHEVVHRAFLADPPADLAHRLSLGDGGGIQVLERRSLVDDVAVSLRTFYLAAELVPTLDEHDLTRDVYELLAAMELRVGRSELVIEAMAADESSANLLEVEAGSALLALENRTWLDDGRPLFVSFGRLRGDRTALALAKRAPGERPEST